MKKLFIIAVLVSLSVLSSAREKDWGRVSASLESLNHFYVKDVRNNFIPSDKLPQLKDGGIYATNNYLKADYYKGRLSAGLQVEGYFPVTAGYPLAQSKLSLSNLYVGWSDESYSVVAGTFYDQLGSGLLFRAWEDRPLGLNNALLGARATYRFKDCFSVKAFWGIPRMGKIADDDLKLRNVKVPVFGLGLTKVNVAAADVSVSLSDCFGWDNLVWALEASMMNKYENIPDILQEQGFRRNNIGWSARVNLDMSGFYFRGEHVDAGVQDYLAIFPKNANAQLIEFGYNEGGLGVSVSARRIYAMNQKIYTSSPDGFVVLDQYNPTVNVLSYCPALCTQYTYMLTNLVPYTPLTDGEAGGQIDAFYNFRRGTLLGGKRGMKVHANFSAYWSLNPEGAFRDCVSRMWDFSFDVEKQWTKKFKTTILYSAQKHNRSEMGTVLAGDGSCMESELFVGESHAVVADLLYKWSSKFSTRLEFQYLATEGYQRDWMAALLEVSFAPHWSVFASDMYNHGGSRMHYYNTGVSYAMRWLRIAAGYGRYRGGFICSGGVCRPIPAYTGANLTLTASF